MQELSLKELSPSSIAWDAWLAKRAGLAAIMERQQKLLTELVAYARQKSNYYREKYGQLPAYIE